MVHAVESRLDTHIAPAVLFEHPTIAEFAAALDTTDTGGDDAGDGLTTLLTTSSDRGQRRRRARSGVRK